jgi:hypothetical protein
MVVALVTWQGSGIQRHDSGSGLSAQDDFAARAAILNRARPCPVMARGMFERHIATLPHSCSAPLVYPLGGSKEKGPLRPSI